MKNRFFTLLLAASCLNAVGQCDADFDFMGAPFGISPDASLGENFAQGAIGQPYEETIHLMIPTSLADVPGSPLPSGLDSIAIESLALTDESGAVVLLADIGLALTPNNNGDSPNPNMFIGGGQYCAQLSGTPTVAGVFSAEISTTVYAASNIPGFTLPPVPFKFAGYTLNLCGQSIPTAGCTDYDACNYTCGATQEDGSCLYPEDVGWCDCDGSVLDVLGDCGGTCTADTDGDGVCDTDEVFGCTIEFACNYNDAATEDDGGCEFVCPGCTDAAACNYNGSALQEDGSCLYPEDFGWCDCDGSVLDVLGDCGGFCTADVDADGICDSIDNCIGTVDACGVCNGPGEIYECGCFTFPEGACDCSGATTYDQCGVCGGDGMSCVGCTYVAACNYDPFATILDVSSCVFGECGGCLDLEACNYNPTVGYDDGSCIYPNAAGECDLDCEGVVDVCGVCDGAGDVYSCGCVEMPVGDCDCNGNVLDALGVCGGNCAADVNGNGICDDAEQEGCTYTTADNYSVVALVDDGSCQFSFDPTSSCGLQYDGNADGAVGSGDLLGLLTEFGSVCEPAVAFACGDPVSYQGYDYATVLIGEQCWFAENLRAENYRNGDAIPSGLSSSDWSNTNSGAVAVYGEGSSICENYSPDGDACDASWSLNEYGRLYNWFAVDDARGLCPSGWHVPSWTSFTDFLGQFSWTQIDPNDWKAAYGWFNSENGTNSSGFSALPGGMRERDSLTRFKGAGKFANWWCSDGPSNTVGQQAYTFHLSYSMSFADAYAIEVRYGHSVRCIKDAE